MPTNRIIRKNMIAHTGDAGIWVTAFGYVINTNPGPEIKKDNVLNKQMFNNY
jgi:hypothetical protein